MRTSNPIATPQKHEIIGVHMTRKPYPVPAIAVHHQLPPEIWQERDPSDAKANGHDLHAILESRQEAEAYVKAGRHQSIRVRLLIDEAWPSAVEDIICEFIGADRGNIWEICGDSNDAWRRAEKFVEINVHRLTLSDLETIRSRQNDSAGEAMYPTKESLVDEIKKSQRAARDAIEQRGLSGSDIRIVGILTDAGRYYESHEEWDYDSKSWCGVDFFDLTQSTANPEKRRGLAVDVSNITGMVGTPIASWIVSD